MKFAACLVVIVVGLILALAGYFGPDDDGLLETIGLVTLGLGCYVLLKTTGAI
jgi:hypothetical protein